MSIVDLGQLLFDTFATDQPTDHFALTRYDDGNKKQSFNFYIAISASKLQANLWPTLIWTNFFNGVELLDIVLGPDPASLRNVWISSHTVSPMCVHVELFI